MKRVKRKRERRAGAAGKAAGGGRRAVWRGVLALLLCLVLGTSVCGCSKGSGKKSGSPGTAADDPDALAFTVKEVSEPKGIEENTTGLGGMVLVGDELVTGAYSKEAMYALVRIPVDGGSGRTVELSMDEAEMPLSAMAIDADGGCFIAVGVRESEGSGGSGTAAVQEEGIRLSAVKLLHYSAEGKRDLEQVIARDPAEDYYCQGISAGGGKVLVSDTRGVWLYDAKSGKAQKRLMKGVQYDTVALLSDGTPVKCNYNNDGKIRLQQIGKKENSVKMSQDISDTRISAGEGKTFYMAGTEYLWRYTLGEKEGTKVVSFTNSDLIAGSPEGICALKNGGYALLTGDGAENVSLLLLSPLEGKRNRTILTLGGYGIDSAVRRQVVRFNRGSEKYRVAIRDYSQEDLDSDDDGEEPAGFTRMQKEMVSGSGPDILVLPRGTGIRSLVKKGVLLDLTDRMKKAGLFDEEKYLTNVFTATQLDGRSFYVVPAFGTVQLAGKTSIIGDGAISFAQLMEIARQRGIDEASIFGPTSREEFLSTALQLSGSRFVDQKAGTCAFDSQAFRELLAYAKELPKEADTDEESQTMYRKNQALLSRSWYFGIDEYQTDLQGNFGEPITLMGFPGDEAKKNRPVVSPLLQVAISATTKHKDVSWQFVRSLLTKSAQKAYLDGTDFGMPVLRESFDQMVEKIQKKDENMSSAVVIGSMEVELRPLKKEEAEVFVQMVESADRTDEVEDKILDIVTEETKGYFSGQKSAEEVSKVIQSRVRTYIQEKS